MNEQADQTSRAPAPERDFHVLKRSAEHLAERFHGTFDPETVERVVFESYAALGRTAKVRGYLAAAAGHFAEDRLRALASSFGRVTAGRPQVLFVDVENAGRSQIAAALLGELADDAVEVRSAGSQPAGQLHPSAVQALLERGIDLTDAYPKPLTDDVFRAADYVVTIGGEAPLALYPDYPVPLGHRLQRLEEYRRTRPGLLKPALSGTGPQPDASGCGVSAQHPSPRGECCVSTASESPAYSD